MSEFLLKQLPVILVVAPLFMACFIVMNRNSSCGKYSFIFTNIIIAAISVVGFLGLEKEFYYNFGDWENFAGIEFKYDKLTAGAVSLLYILASIFSIFSYSSYKDHLESYLRESRRYIPYALFLVVEAGYAGIILTNDIFNFYVLLEIASIASYPLLAIGRKRALVMAYEYLIIGSIAATAILISIGLILAVTGSLNLTYIEAYLENSDVKINFILGFMICGIATKLAMFPLYDWKVKSYTSTSPITSSFFLTLASIPFIITLVKFGFLINSLNANVIYLLNILGGLSVLFGAYFAFKDSNFRRTIILASISSAGYYFMLLPYDNPQNYFVLCQLIIIDSLIKLSLMFLLLSLDLSDFHVNHMAGFAKKHKYIAIIYSLLFLNASALPPTIYFFAKLNLITILYAKNIYLLFFPLLSSLLLAMTFIRISRQFIKNKDEISHFTVKYIPIFGIVLCMILLFSLIAQTEELLLYSTLLYMRG